MPITIPPGNVGPPVSSLPPGPIPSNGAPGTTYPPGQQTNIGNTTPPPMQTLVYSPDVQILISHGGKQYNLSSDLVRGTVIRKENAASTLMWTCHNKQLRYTNGPGNRPLFSRMDRVTCYMKRAGTWIQVFSGYLDSIPYLQLYPGLVEFKATCTIKRLLCNWWNPALQESVAILNQYNTTERGVSGDGQFLLKDTGMGTMLRDILIKVGGWDPSTVHIQDFPIGMLDLLVNQTKQQGSNDKQAEEFKRLLLGDTNNPAPGASAGANHSAGLPGAMGSGAAFYVHEIIAACDSMGLGPSVRDLNVNAGQGQVAQIGEGSRDQATRDAFTKQAQVVQVNNSAMRNTDAAILGVATAMVESSLRNLSNASVPGSDAIQPNDGPGADGTSVGLFQQIDGWGTAAQRMNPRQSAMMFFQHLIAVSNWQNMDPGTACYKVQLALDPVGYAQKINNAIPAATQMVQTARGASGGGAPVSPLSSPSLGAGSATDAQAAGGNATFPATSTPATPADSRVGKPSPDSEGAIQWAMTQLGKPYKYGASGPDAWDCSSLLQAAFSSIDVAIGRDTIAQQSTGRRIAPSDIRRGDAMQIDGGGHTMLWLGNGQILEASTEGVPVHVRPAYTSPAQASGIFRYADNGGEDPTAPHHAPSSVGPGNPPYTGGSSGGGASSTSSEGIAQNLFTYYFQPQRFMSGIALMYSAATPEKDFLDAQPLIQMVQAIATASLRRFCSAPNGDFIAYYPDEFGMDFKPNVFILEDIELKDFTMNFSDDALATHVYVCGDYTGVGLVQQPMGWLHSLGYATVENTNLFARMQLVAPGDLESMTGQALMERFGVRPIQITYASVWSTALEFLLSVQMFMEKWAAQYQSSISTTFMPDLFPGMRVQLAKHNVQCYVNEATHTFDFEQGFATTAVLTAPSNPNVRNMWPSGHPPTTPPVTPTTPAPPLAPPPAPPAPSAPPISPLAFPGTAPPNPGVWT